MALNEFRREVAILKACRDPNIVAFLGACLRDDCAMLVTEYCEGGNLARNILAHKVTWYKRGRKVGGGGVGGVEGQGGGGGWQV
jgi:serine/threonine protein kinase